MAQKNKMSKGKVRQGTNRLARSVWGKCRNIASTHPVASLVLLVVAGLVASLVGRLGNSAGNLSSHAATLMANAAQVVLSISSQPASQTVTAGSSVSYTLTVTSPAGFNGTVSFSAAGLPAGATATFNPASLNGNGSSTVTVSTNPSASAGTYTVSLNGTSGSLTNSALVNLRINSAASGLNYYVSPTGSDANSGSASSPWMTIQHAAQAVGGDPNGVTVHVAAGTYPGSVSSSLSGTASGRIRFVSDVPWAAKIDAQNASNGWTVSGDYEDIVGFEIYNAARGGIVYVSSHVRFLQNKFHDIAVNTPCDSGGGAAVEPDSYTNSDAEISNNVIYNIGPGGGTTRCNTIHGIYFAVPVGKAVNNLISTITGDCITSWHYSTNLTIENNTVTGCLDAGILIGADATTSDNNIVANNIVINGSNVGIAEEGNLGTHNLYLNNLFYNVPTPFQWVTGSASGTITSNPLVVNDTGSASTGNYHLPPASPAVNAGTNQYCPSADLDGYPRPYGAACDVGAYEWHP